MIAYDPERGGRGAGKSAIRLANEEASANHDADPAITDAVTVADQDPHRSEGDPGTQDSAGFPYDSAGIMMYAVVGGAAMRIAADCHKRQC